MDTCMYRVFRCCEPSEFYDRLKLATRENVSIARPTDSPLFVERFAKFVTLEKFAPFGTKQAAFRRRDLGQIDRDSLERE